MVNFIELTSTYDHPVLINMNSIAHIEPYNKGTKIHLCATHITSSENAGNLRSVNGCAETVYVKESYQVVKHKLDEL